jgi:hypothetical protein
MFECVIIACNYKLNLSNKSIHGITNHKLLVALPGYVTVFISVSVHLLAGIRAADFAVFKFRAPN